MTPAARRTLESALLALATRSEIEEPSRELDAAIDLAVNPGSALWSPGMPNDFLRWPDLPTGAARYRQIERYTSSLDAAVTLVPEGWAWGVENFCGNAARCIGPENNFGDVPTGYSDVLGVKTPALALCAAALRARAAMAGE